MPDTCCAVGCTNRRTAGGIPFYRIPVDKKRREKWLNAIKRDQWNEKMISNARLCGSHFISGESRINLFFVVFFSHSLVIVVCRLNIYFLRIYFILRKTIS